MSCPSSSVLTSQPHPYGKAAFEKVGVRVMSIWVVLTKKIPATNAGTKFQNKEKPAACELLTAGVGCDVNKWISLASLLYYIIL